MKQTEERFSIDGAMDKELPKSVFVHAFIDLDGKCSTEVKTNKLTAEQEIKLVSHVMLKLNLMVFRAFRRVPHDTDDSLFDRITPSPAYTDGEKGVKIWSTLPKDKTKTPEVHVEFHYLTPEQFAKLILVVNIKLSEITFDRLGLIKGDTSVSTIGVLKERIEEE